MTFVRTRPKYRDLCTSASILDVRTNIKSASVLDIHTDDLSDVVPHHSQSFNLAAYVNTSETLQNLVHLNVNLSKIEKKPYITENILKLDFHRDMKRNILFLKEFVNVDCIGDFITMNPLILCEPVEDLEVRVNYLQSKSFNIEAIKRIISKNPFWLMFSTVRIDRRLGFFQNKFELNGYDMRYLASKQPKLITYQLNSIITNSFVIKEEMGFNDKEVKSLLLKKPKLWMLNQRSLFQRFNYIHNIMNIPHERILQHPDVLMSRNFRVKQRHEFLDKLGRSQYNPAKENYVPLMALCEGTDIDFCTKFAKCNVDDFNIFLKTQV
ncbi:unnamed protein product [Leptidea sinapis]|uniref:Transcription termination factor 3, mitochondrial n=1 Tax=Leptidea sinapis TaxID=189913 RepID=A0A5E4Q3U8_9NEOP|nr:unnamed protein product [Leptidea sinapis]